MRSNKKKHWLKTIGILLSLLLAHLLAVLWAWPVIADDAAKPSFASLVGSAETIVEGKAIFICPAPSYWLPILIYGLGVAIVGILLMQSHKRGLKATMITGVPFFLLGLVLAFMVGLTYTGYKWTAVLSVDEVLKGSGKSRWLNVHYRGFRMYDYSRFEIGKRYLVFLRRPDSSVPLLCRPVLVPSWWDWAIWEITPSGVTTRALVVTKLPPKPLEEFKEGVRQLIVNPRHPDYARIWKPGYGPLRILKDPFFNPELQVDASE